MKTPLIFLLLINLLYLTAQEQRTTFFTRYDTIPMSWTQAIDYENNFLRVYSSSPIGFSVIEKLDNKGTSLSIDSLTNYPRNSYFPKLIKTNNGYVIAFSSMTNILENDFMDADIKVQFYDENLYLLLDTTYISLYEDRFVDIIQTNDNGFLILSNKNNISVNPIEKSLNLTKINAQGEIVWEKEMVTDAKALLMNEFNTSTILIISENIDNFERYFTQIDENGNILNEISYTLPLLNTPTDLIQHNENELLLIGSYKKGNDNSLPRGVILKIDTIGNILDSTFYMFDEATEFKKIIKNHKNNYCIIGAKGTASYVNESNYYRNSFFLEMDTSGEILWSKEFNYSSNAQRTILNSLKQTSDNGYILTGNIRILPSDILYSTYKLDCNACDSISCYFKDSICNPADCIRYQNDNLFSVEVDSTQLVNNVINIDLFNSEEYDYLTWDFGDGTQLSALLLTQSFEYEYDNPGFYDISLIFSKGICTDTTTFNLYVGDGLKLSENEENTLFQLYPNPNSGQFELLHYFDGEVSMKIMNAIGQEVFVQNNLSPKHSFHFSLRSGIYFVYLTNNGNNYKQKMLVY